MITVSNVRISQRQDIVTYTNCFVSGRLPFTYTTCHLNDFPDNMKDFMYIQHSLYFTLMYI